MQDVALLRTAGVTWLVLLAAGKWQAPDCKTELSLDMHPATCKHEYKHKHNQVSAACQHSEFQLLFAPGSSSTIPRTLASPRRAALCSSLSEQPSPIVLPQLVEAAWAGAGHRVMHGASSRSSTTAGGREERPAHGCKAVFPPGNHCQLSNPAPWP